MTVVVVTGGRGFIGQAVCNELTRRGHYAAPFDRSHGDDIRHAGAIKEAMVEADACIHLAGVLGTHELFDSPGLAVEVNVQGTLNVLDACVASGAAYVGITMPAVFPSIYTATKLAAGGLEDAYAHNYGLPVSRVRAFNAFGPGQAHGRGHPQKIIPTFATEAWANRPIPIWGDGTQTVDLVYVDDLAFLLVEALSHPGVTLDGGTGQAFTVNAVANMVLEATRSRAGVHYLPMRRGEVPTRIVATGEGWDRIDWGEGWAQTSRKPAFRHEDLLKTIAWYAP